MVLVIFVTLDFLGIVETLGGSPVRFYRTTAVDGKSYNTQLSSLPLVLAVDYQLCSTRGTQLRQ